MFTDKSRIYISCKMLSFAMFRNKKPILPKSPNIPNSNMCKNEYLHNHLDIYSFYTSERCVVGILHPIKYPIYG